MLELGLALQLLTWALVTLLFVISGRASLFHPATLYLFFHAIVFVLRPILVHCFQFDMIWNYMGYEPPPEIFLKTLAVSSLAMVVFVVACVGCGGRPVPIKTTCRAFALASKKGLVMVTVLLMPLIACSIYATRNGIIGERIGAVYINTDSVGYLNDAKFVLAPLICAWLLVTRFHWANLLLIAGYVAYRSWFGWSRWTILLFFLMVILNHCWLRGAKWPSLWLVLGALPTLLLFNALGHNRDVLKNYLQRTETTQGDYIPGLTAAQKIKKQIDTLDFGSFDFLAYIVAVVPERTGEYTAGLQYAQLFTEPIPRKLWKNKPVGSPLKLINLNAYGNFIGLTYSLPGDGWMSGGWTGVILTMALVGCILGWAHSLFWRHFSNNMVSFFYIIGFAVVPQWFRDGGISIFKFLLFTWLPSLLWLGTTWWFGPRTVRGWSIRWHAEERVQLG